MAAKKKQKKTTVDAKYFQSSVEWDESNHTYLKIVGDNTGKNTQLRKEVDVVFFTKLRERLYLSMPFEKFLDVMTGAPFVFCFTENMNRLTSSGKKATRFGFSSTFLGVCEAVYSQFLSAPVGTDRNMINAILSHHDLVRMDNLPAVLEKLLHICKLPDHLFKNHSEQQIPTTVNQFRESLSKNKSLLAHYGTSKKIKIGLKTEFKFTLDDDQHHALRTTRTEIRNKKLRHVNKHGTIPEVVFTNAVQILKTALDQETGDFIPNAVLLVQSVLGSRFIEVLCASAYLYMPNNMQELSDVLESSEVMDKPDRRGMNRSTYVLVVGVAKTPADHDNEANEKNDDDPVDSRVLDLLIPKPLLFTWLGITPAYVKKLIRRIREQIYREHPQFGLRTEEESLKDVDQKRGLTYKYIQQCIRRMSEVYQEASKKYRINDSDIYIDSWPNKTHALRKLYASYSHFVYARTTNQNVWIKDVLGHISIETSFNYANMVVGTHTRSNFMVQEMERTQKALCALAALVNGGEQVVVQELDDMEYNGKEEIDEEDDHVQNFDDENKDEDDGNDRGWKQHYREWVRVQKNLHKK